MGEGSYYVRWRGRVTGPFDVEALRKMAGTQQLSKLHELSSDGINWQRADTVEGIIAVYVRPTPPPSAQSAAADTMAPANEGTPAAGGEWFYSRDGQIAGPCAAHVVRTLLAEGLLRRTDFVSRAENPSAWQVVADIPEFAVAPILSGSPASPMMAARDVARVTPTRTSGLAIASLVLSILGCGIGSILGVIFGHQALSEIEAGKGEVDGRGMAIAGLVLGYLGLIGCVLLVALAVAGVKLV